MKQCYIQLLCLLIMVMPMTIHADEHAQVVKQDQPIAQWRFEDQAADSAAPGLGRAMRVTRATALKLALPKPVRGDLSVEWWAFFDASDGDIPLLACGSAKLRAGVSPENQKKKNAPAQFALGDSFLDYPTPTPRLPRPAGAYPGKWYHLVAVLHADGQQQIYVNGHPAQAIQSTGSTDPISHLTFGGAGFNGFVDEVAAYDIALPAPRIAAHFASAIRSLAPRAIATVAHRGDNQFAPENTRISYVQAIAKGAPIVEIDLQLSKDGKLVLMHDKTLERTTTGQGKVLDATAAEMEKLDAGTWFDPKFKGEPVPRIEAIDALCRGKAIMMLDLKCTGLGPAIADWLAASGFPKDQVLLAPWDDVEGVALRKVLPDVPMVRLTSTVPDMFDDAYFAKMRKIGFSGFSVYWGRLSQAFIDGAQKHGMKIYTWTINAPSEVNGAILAGVDGIITDDPAGTMKLIDTIK